MGTVDLQFQPWRFVYAPRGQPEFETFLLQLVAFSRGWVCHAAALLDGPSKQEFTAPGKT